MIFKHLKAKLSYHPLRESQKAAEEQLKAQEPKVNLLAGWLERRNLQNGFGDDIEYTLRPRGN